MGTVSIHEILCFKLPISKGITVLYLHQNYLELYGIKSANNIDYETQLESLSNGCLWMPLA